MKRAAFLEHVGWTGGGIAFAMTAGGTFAEAATGSDVSFVQISDSHIGFKQPANPDVAATLNAIRTALATLPRDQRAVIELAYWGDLTQSEIAARLGLPLGTIKSRAALGLRKLARTLKPQDLA